MTELKRVVFLHYYQWQIYPLRLNSFLPKDSAMIEVPTLEATVPHASLHVHLGLGLPYIISRLITLAIMGALHRLAQCHMFAFVR